MINNLAYKSNNEKYFKSIRYFSHSLKEGKRRSFIIELAEHNIYLAAQCVMSAEKDVEVEKILIEKSESLARDYKNSENSAKGFLSLAEFECYEIISNLLKEVKKPSNTHLKVFIKILEGNNSGLFISFIEIFLNIKKLQFVHFAVNAYKGKLLVNSDNREILYKLFNHLLILGQYGNIKVIIEKYNLFEDLQYILRKDPKELVAELFNCGKKKIQALKLAYMICKYFDLFQIFSGERFIEAGFQKDSISSKRLPYAIDIALRHDIHENIWIDAELNNLASKPTRKSQRWIRKLIRFGLFDYLKNNETLVERLKSILTMSFITNPVLENKKSVEFGKHFNSKRITDHSEKLEVITNFDLPIQDCLTEFFRSPGRRPIDNFLKEVVDKYNSNLKEVSHLLRIYEVEGIVKYMFDYGCYVQPLQFKASNLMFLHLNQITTEKVITSPKDIFKEGEIIRFRIIGINQKNFRLNISCLEEFIPK